jgi:hypothetical protein|tara:strand:+ start:246 stop:509 length:264 start_codon:yes stop_codon:yes gene_type:complete
MTITKETEIGKIEVISQFKHIQVRTDTVIKEDGVELSRAYHRHVVHCNASDEDLAKEHADVQAVANSGIWTQAVKDAYVAKLSASIG